MHTRRLALTGIVGLAMFFGAWLAAESLAGLARSDAIAVAAAIDAVVFGALIALATQGRANRSSVRALTTAEVIGQLRTSVTRSTAEQVQALTDRGLLAVPWTVRSAKSTATGASHSGHDEDDALGRFVAEGGRLIIIGGSQSGKTTLATRLVNLIAGHTDRLPVVFTLATWSPRRTRLMGWMLEVLQANYNLDTSDQLNAALTALQDGAVIPIFDGFDEIEASLRPEAAMAIRRFVRERPAVLTSVPLGNRPGLVTQALGEPKVISLRPVGVHEVGRYLRDAQAGEHDQWARISSHLADDRFSALGVALSSPLIAWLAKSVYAASDGTVVPRPDAIELLNRQAFPNSAAVEEYLLGGLVSAVFSRKLSSPDAPIPPAEEFRPLDAERWLRFLSSRARDRIIAFWEIRRYAPLYRLSLVLGIVAGAGIALIDRSLTVFAGLTYLAVVAGLAFGFGFACGYSAGRSRGPQDPTRIGFSGSSPEKPRKDGSLREHGLRALSWLSIVLLGYGTSLVTQFTLYDSLSPLLGLSARQWAAGLAFAVMAALTVSVIGGRIAASILRANPALDATTGARAADPLAAIRSDRRSGIGMFITATATLAAGFMVYYLAFLPSRTIWAVCLAPVGGTVATFFWNQWACYKAAHVWLAIRDYLPWRLTRFLRDCHDGGILRKNGNRFEFRHQRLQRALSRPASALVYRTGTAFEIRPGTAGLTLADVAHILIPGRGRDHTGFELNEGGHAGVDVACELYQTVTGTRAGIIVCSGYKSPIDLAGAEWSPPEAPQEVFHGMPEADLMRQRLLELSIPRQAIAVERHSIDTVTNLLRSELEDHFGDSRPVAIVAQADHLHRILSVIAPRTLRRPYLGVVVPDADVGRRFAPAAATAVSRLILAGLPRSPAAAIAVATSRAGRLWGLARLIGVRQYP